MIKSKWWGSFDQDEVVAIIMHGPCGREYVYKGMVHGIRECMGREYLSIMGEDGYVYEVSHTEASHILRGEEARVKIEKTHRMRQERMKKHHEKHGEHEHKEHEEHEEHHHHHEAEKRETVTKYNRI